HLLADEARRDIGRPARRERDDDVDRPVGKRLSARYLLRGAGGQPGRAESRQCNGASSTNHGVLRTPEIGADVAALWFSLATGFWGRPRTVSTFIQTPFINRRIVHRSGRSTVRPRLQ